MPDIDHYIVATVHPQPGVSFGVSILPSGRTYLRTHGGQWDVTSVGGWSILRGHELQGHRIDYVQERISYSA